MAWGTFLTIIAQSAITFTLIAFFVAVVTGITKGKR